MVAYVIIAYDASASTIEKEGQDDNICLMILSATP